MVAKRRSDGDGYQRCQKHQFDCSHQSWAHNITPSVFGLAQRTSSEHSNGESCRLLSYLTRGMLAEFSNCSVALDYCQLQIGPRKRAYRN